MSSNVLQNEFRNKGFNVQHDWLTACINQQNTHSRYLIMQQLLCSDIVDWGQPSIPNNFNTFNKQEWNGEYVLQIDKIINLCAPKFEDKNIDPLVNPKLLRLKLTDGHSYIYGMVYQAINGLSLNLSLHSKIVIKNVYVRRGYLLLTNANAVILNGTMQTQNEEKKSDDNNNNNNNNNRNNNNNNVEIRRNSEINNNNNRRQANNIGVDINLRRNNNNNNINHNRNGNNNINNNNNIINNNNNNNATGMRRNIAIAYDNNNDNSFLVRSNPNPNPNVVRRKLTQKERLCGFGAEKQGSIYIEPSVIREEKEKLHRNQVKNAMKKWTCKHCTFVNVNQTNRICQVCNNEDKENKNKKKNKKRMSVDNDNDNDNEEDDDIQILRNDNKKNKNNKKNKKNNDNNDTNLMDWDIELEDGDFSMTNMKFGDEILSTNNNVNNRNNNISNKPKKKKKKFF